MKKQISLLTLLIIFSLSHEKTFASEKLQPLNANGLQILSQFIKNDTISSTMVVDKKGMWPVECNSNNKVYTQAKGDGIRLYTFFVTASCNAKLTTFEKNKVSPNFVPIKIRNIQDLKYKYGEIALLAQKIESPDFKTENLKVLGEDFESNPRLAAYTITTPYESIFDQLFKDEIITPDPLEINTISGITQRMSLDYSGDHLPASTPCDRSHDHNDIANNFCHGMVSNVVQQNMIGKGFNRYLSHLVGTSIFVAKEAFDQKYNLDDIALVNIRLFDTKGQLVRQKILGTVFFGGTFYFVWQGSY